MHTATAHHISAIVDTCQWAVIDPKIPSMFPVQSGARLIIDTVGGGPDMLSPAYKFRIPPELADNHARTPRNVPGHVLTGPAFVEGVEAGDTLEVRIIDIKLRQDWSYSFIRALAGTLPAEFDTYWLIYIPLYCERMVALLPRGLDLPLRPFFGVMCVSPPARRGWIGIYAPRAHDIYFDNKELRQGSLLFLPVHVLGVNYSCVGGCAAQGDGRACTTAIKTLLQGIFEPILHKKKALSYPRAETPTHNITMGMTSILHLCMDMAVARHDRFTDRARPVARGCLYAVQGRRGLSHHANRLHPPRQACQAAQRAGSTGKNQ